MKNIRESEKILRKTADVLNIEPEQVPAVLKKFQKEISEVEMEIQNLKRK